MTGEITDTPDQFLAEKADAIRALARRSVFEIGKHLVEARDKCPHGKWLPWLRDEFGWSHTTADKYMAIYTAMKDGQIAPKLQFGLSMSSLALLAAPSTPEEARTEVAEQAKAVIEQAKPGKKIPHAQVKATVDKHRGTKPQPQLRETRRTVGGPIIVQTVGRVHAAIVEAIAELEGPDELDTLFLALETEFSNLGRRPTKASRRKFSGDFEWYTPGKYIEAARAVLGGIDIDPASSEVAQETVRAEKFYTIATNGLSQAWRGRVWLNPPYSGPLVSQFVDKLVAELRAGDVTTAILLSSNGTDAAWFHHAAQAATAICFTYGRIKFVDANSVGGGGRVAPPSGSAFLYFGPDVLRFHAVFAKFGTMMVPWHAKAAIAAEAAE
jgi:hypothetical protein